LIIIRNNHQVAKISPGPATMTALEAMSDLYRTLPEDAGATWVKPWDSSIDTVCRICGSPVRRYNTA